MVEPSLLSSLDVAILLTIEVLNTENKEASLLPIEQAVNATFNKTIPRSSFSRALARLEQSGLIEAFPGRARGTVRVFNYKVSPAGKTQVKELCDPIATLRKKARM